jgi:hypothetical protein
MGAEAILMAFVGLAGIALLALFRRERERPQSTPPILLGVYRGFTFLIVLFIGYAVFIALSKSFD